MGQNDFMPPLILASSSVSRAHVLASAGVQFVQDAPRVDEGAVKERLQNEKASAAECAETLAKLKAIKVSHKHKKALVVGADQVLECDGNWFNKPVDIEQARISLLALRGKTHQLWTCAAVARGGGVIWKHVSVAHLTMRPFTESFLNWYVARAGDLVTQSVGAYQLEGPGAQLFSKIHGDFFAILGLPLLPLMAFLRESEAVLI